MYWNVLQMHLPHILESVLAPVFALCLGRVMPMWMKSLRVKKKREVMSLIEKMEVLGELDRGMSSAVIRHHYGGCE